METVIMGKNRKRSAIKRQGEMSKKGLSVSFHEEAEEIIEVEESEELRRKSFPELAEAFTSPRTDDDKRRVEKEVLMKSDTIEISTPTRSNKGSPYPTRHSPHAEKVRRRLSDFVDDPKKIDDILIPHMTRVYDELNKIKGENVQFSQLGEALVDRLKDVMEENSMLSSHCRSMQTMWDGLDEDLVRMAEEDTAFKEAMKKYDEQFSASKTNNDEEHFLDCAEPDLRDQDSPVSRSASKRRLTKLDCRDCEKWQTLYRNTELLNSIQLQELEQELKNKKKEILELGEHVSKSAKKNKKMRDQIKEFERVQTPTKPVRMEKDVGAQVDDDEKRVLKLRVDDLEEEFKSVKEQKDRIENELNHALSVIQARSDVENNITDELLDKTQQLTKATKEKEALIRRVEELSRLESADTSLMAEKDELLADLQAKVASAEVTQTAMDKQNDELWEKNQRKHQMILKLREDNEKLQNDLRAAKMEASRGKRVSEGELTGLHAKIRNLESEISIANDQRLLAIKKLADAEKIIKDMKREKAEMEVERKQFKSGSEKLSKSQAEIDSLNRQLKAEVEKRKALEKEIFTLKSHLKEKAKKGDSMDKLREKLRHENETQAKELKAKLNSKSAEIDKLHKEIFKTKTDLRACEQRHTDERYENVKLRRENKECVEKVQAMEKELENVTKMLADVKESRRQEVKNLTADISNAVLRNHQLEEKLEIEIGKGPLDKFLEKMSGCKSRVHTPNSKPLLNFGASSSNAKSASSSKAVATPTRVVEKKVEKKREKVEEKVVKSENELKKTAKTPEIAKPAPPKPADKRLESVKPPAPTFKTPDQQRRTPKPTELPSSAPTTSRPEQKDQSKVKVLAAAVSEKPKGNKNKRKLLDKFHEDRAKRRQGAKPGEKVEVEKPTEPVLAPETVSTFSNDEPTYLPGDSVSVDDSVSMRSDATYTPEFKEFESDYAPAETPDNLDDISASEFSFSFSTVSRRK